jgi:hypothetical protein
LNNYVKKDKGISVIFLEATEREREKERDRQTERLGERERILVDQYYVFHFAVYV